MRVRKNTSVAAAALISLLIGAVLSVSVYYVVVELIHKRQLVAITEAAEERVAAIRVAIESELAVLDAVVGFHEASNKVTQREFEIFLKRALKRNSGIDLVAWVPALQDQDRAAFEQLARRDDFSKYQVSERLDATRLRQATTREQYYPVRKIYPQRGNEHLIGLDLASIPRLHELLTAAPGPAGFRAATDNDLIVRDGDASGLAIFYPFTGVNRDEQAAPLAEPGYIVVRMELGRIIELGLQRGVPLSGGLDIFAHDTDVDGKPGSLLYYHPSRSRTSTADELMADDSFGDRPVSSIVRIGDYRLSFIFRPLARIWEGHSYGFAWLAFAVAVLASLLITQQVVSIIRRRDIAESVAVDRSAQLADSELRFRTLVETVVDGIITISTNGTIESYNPAAERIFGYTPDEVTGRNVNMLMPEPYHSEHDQYLRNYLTTGEAKVIGTGREVTGRRKDGSTFPLELAVSEMRIGNRRVFTGIVRDISERKKIDRMKTEFISVVSHELRTPLTSIRGSLGLIAGGAIAEIPPKIKSLLDIATNNCERLVRLINDILDVEKIESGKMEFDKKPVDLATLVTEGIKANQMYAESFAVRLQLKDSIDAVQVLADADRITQVVTNLLSNAAKYSPGGGVVDVAITRHAGMVRVAITDHGRGVPDEFRSEVFNKFAQADSSDTRQKGGTGLGLSICKAIVERHDGKIGFESVPGVATTFYFDLPEHRVTAESANGKPAQRLGNAPRVLVCEDDPDVAKLIALMLQRDGCEIDIAYSAEQAKKLLAANDYDAMTLDLMLPGQDGISLLRELRGDERTRPLPVIVVSAKADEGRRELNGGAVGVVDWLSKPIDQDRLVRALKTAMKNDMRHRPRILHVEDDRDLVSVVSGLLAGDADVVGAYSIAEARELLAQSAFDLVVLDLMMPDGSSEELLPIIEQQQDPMPIIVLSGHDISNEIARRVSHVLTKGRVSNERLVSTVRAMTRDR